MDHVWLVSSGVPYATFGLDSVHASEAGAMAAVQHLRNVADPYRPGREVDWNYMDWEDNQRWQSSLGTIEIRRKEVHQ